MRAIMQDVKTVYCRMVLLKVEIDKACGKITLAWV